MENSLTCFNFLNLWDIKMLDKLIKTVRKQGQRCGKSIGLERNNMILTLTELPSMGYLILEAKNNECSWYYSKSSDGVTTSELVLPDGTIVNI